MDLLRLSSQIRYAAVIFQGTSLSGSSQVPGRFVEETGFKCSLPGWGRRRRKGEGGEKEHRIIVGLAITSVQTPSILTSEERSTLSLEKGRELGNPRPTLTLCLRPYPRPLDLKYSWVTFSLSKTPQHGPTLLWMPTCLFAHTHTHSEYTIHPEGYNTTHTPVGIHCIHPEGYNKTYTHTHTHSE